MNRKQKIAIVLGALVLVGVALFPPWVFDDGEFAEVGPWRLTHGPTFIASPPRPPGATGPLTLPDLSGSPELSREALVELRGYYASAELDGATWLAHLAATLAVTVAAVVLLKDRDGGA